jgi:hypothetical protein
VDTVEEVLEHAFTPARAPRARRRRTLARQPAAARP